MAITGVLLLFLATYCFAYDPTIYKNCTENALCSANRGLERQERYTVLLEGATFSRGLARFRVADSDGNDNVVLNITALVSNSFRVQIEETDSSRYHLSDVLVKEPTIRDFDNVELSLDAADIRVGSARAVINFSPFSIEFFSSDVNTLVLQGDRLTLLNDELHTPFTVGFTFPAATNLYGLHEHADNLALRTTSPDGDDPYRVKTMDMTNYELFSTMAMYGAVPVLYGHGPQRSTGIFLHNAAEQWVEITNNASANASEAFFMVDSGALDLFVLLGPSIPEVVRQYTLLTGVTALPPMWTLGYHQCRWGYADQTDVETVIADLDANDFPVDAIWLDIQHTQDMKFFTWNSENFSDPAAMLENLASTNRYLITLSDPHFKKEEGYFVYDEALANDYFIKNPNGTVFEDECWPGTSSWMDYLNPAARDYYSSLYSYENWNGTSSTLGGIWNDMNEAAIFNEPNEKTFPYDVVHYGGVSNRDIHNMYGFLQTMATHKGLMDRDNGTLRPFILTRAHFAGSQRYAAFWTGDNTAEFGFIPMAFSMCLNANLLGLVFCGADVGGFFGEPSEELLQRFYQAGAWLPFFREHSNIGSERREPYLYSDEVQAVIREAIKTRYVHLPVWYTLFFDHEWSGSPVIRPLFYHYPTETDCFEVDDQLLLGESILVKAIGESGVESVPVYFPGGQNVLWFSAELDGTYYRGTGWQNVSVTIDRIPVFYKQGSIIFTKKTSRPNTTQMKDDPLTLIILLNTGNLARGSVYIDDNLTFEYKTSSKYNHVRFYASGLGVSVNPADESDKQDLPVTFDEFIYIRRDENGNYVKKIFNDTADGTLLADQPFTGESLWLYFY